MVCHNTTSSRQMQRRDSKLSRKLAALAGATGAIAAGTEAQAVTYVPTAGVVAAQNIPGFSFSSPTTVTSGTLRPPASTGSTGWDIDGNGQADFNLSNQNPPAGFLNALQPFSLSPNGVLCVQPEPLYIRNLLLTNIAVGPGATYWRQGSSQMTYNASLQAFMQDKFTAGVPGYFGFRFAFENVSNQYYYGWASLTIDESAPGQRFRIGEAFYQSTPNTAITLGAVPVPEPSSMALLAAGAAGVTAWRARRKKQPTSDA